MRTFSLFACSALLMSSTAFAMEPIPGEERFAGKVTDPSNEAAGQLGFAKMNEDYFMQLTLRTGLNFGKVGIGLQVPLNLRVWDKDPENNDDYYGMVRYEDWNEPAKWLKVIRYVRYGHKSNEDDVIYAQVGELAAQIGHGTIMDRYLNNLDMNTFHLGSAFDVYTNYGGVETVVSNYGSVFGSKDGSRIVGGRVYVKPVGFVDPESSLNIFAIGASVVSDLNAPRELASVARVNADNSTTLEPVLDKDGNLKASKSGAQTVWGVDAEAKLLNTAMIQITPYTDLNFIDGAGWGWHLGTLITLSMPIGFELTIPMRFEYRRMKNNYIPAYFGTFYEVERYSFPTNADVSVPKSALVRAANDDGGLNGYYGDLAFNFAGLVAVGGIYEWYDNTDPNFALFATLPAIEVIQAKAYYTRQGVKDGNDAFKLDDRSLLIAEARYEIFTYTYLVGRFTRRWALIADQAEKDFGTYKSSDDYKFGIEFALTF